MKLKELITKDDLIYFFSIIASIPALTALNSLPLQTYLQDFLNFTCTPTNFIYLFSALLLLLIVLKRFVTLIKKKDEAKHQMWENDVGLALGSILVSCLIYSTQNQEKACDEKELYKLVIWFVVGRLLSFVGEIMNRLGSIRSWNTLGDSISLLTVLMGVGIALEVDPYVFI